ncbi:hypothetical protein ACFX11_038073 [Malus domestica]
MIKHIQLSPFQTNHILIWNAEANGKFSSQSAYHLARMHGDVNGGQAGGSVLNGDVKFLWKAIWRANVPEKVKICVWRCCLNAVPTPSNQKKKKVLMEISCIFCRGDEETIKHLLRDCPRSVAVIAEQKFWIGAEDDYGGAMQCLSSLHYKTRGKAAATPRAFNYGHKATDAKDPQLESQAHSKRGEQGFCVLFQVTLLFDFLGFCEQAWKPFMLKVGELAARNQVEERYDVIMSRIEEMGLPAEPYGWCSHGFIGEVKVIKKISEYVAQRRKFGEVHDTIWSTCSGAIYRYWCPY